MFILWFGMQQCKTTGLSIVHIILKVTMPSLALEAKLHAGLPQHLELVFQFSLPKTISDTAKQLFKRLDEENFDAVFAACIFITCCQALLGQPKSAEEISEVADVSESTVKLMLKGEDGEPTG